MWQARLPSQAPEIDGVTLINDFEGVEPRAGEIRRARVTESHDYDLVATLLAATEEPPEAAAPIHRPPALVNIEPLRR